MLQIALPNKGSLSEDAVRLVQEAGYACRRYGRELAVRDAENDIDFVFLRPRDIAVYVSHGVLDLGITGRDLARDCDTPTEELMPLGFGFVERCYGKGWLSTRRSSSTWLLARRLRSNGWLVVQPPPLVLATTEN